MIPNLIGMDASQRFAGTFAETGTAHAGGFAHHFFVQPFSQKLRAKLVEKDLRIATLVAAWPGTDQQAARLGRPIEDILDGHPA